MYLGCYCGRYWKLYLRICCIYFRQHFIQAGLFHLHEYVACRTRCQLYQLLDWRLELHTLCRWLAGMLHIPINLLAVRPTPCFGRRVCYCRPRRRTTSWRSPRWDAVRCTYSHRPRSWSPSAWCSFVSGRSCPSSCSRSDGGSPCLLSGWRSQFCPVDWCRFLPCGRPGFLACSDGPSMYLSTLALEPFMVLA